MQKIKDFMSKKQIILGIIPSVFTLIVGSMFIFACVFIINKIPFSFTPQSLLLSLLNAIPIISAVTLMFFILNNAVSSVVINGVFFIIMSIANAQKIQLRQDPVFPADLKLFTELIGIAKGFTLETIVLYVIILSVAILSVILTFLFFKTKKMSPALRLGGIASVLAFGLFMNTAVYANVDLYDSFPVDGNPFFEVNQYNSKGFVYSFCYKFNAMKVEAPKGYSKTEIEISENSFVSSPGLYKGKKLPHIVMVMSEAYSDLSENEHLDFSNYKDPMKNWKSICKNKNTLSGHIVVPGFGGGTSDTEFDVLTAMPTRFVGSASNSYSLIRKDIDAIPKRLKTIGYDTLAIHPGYSWFYNRINVYPHMGFDDFIHLESFQGIEKYLGGYISDKCAADSIIENFENQIANSDNPFFEFTVTIENHGPYDQKYDNLEKTFDTDVSLTSTEETLLNNYFTGINSADAMLKQLTKYFEASDEPVVFVFFGDHLPGFSNGMDFFDILDYNIDANGTTEQLLNIYETPFLIWQNSASEELFSLAENAKKIDFKNDSVISANYLGSSVLQLIGINDISPLLDFSNMLRAEVPVITNKNFLLKNGEYTNTLDDAATKDVEKLKRWVYYKMFEK